jgi:hypothetical protein
MLYYFRYSNSIVMYHKLNKKLKAENDHKYHFESVIMVYDFLIIINIASTKVALNTILS